MSGNEKLGGFLKEVANWGWDEFVRAEHDKQYSSNQAIIFALIRACSIEKIDAIRIALNRLDGKLKTPVKIEMPKVFYLFPNATLSEPEGAGFAQVTDNPDTTNEVRVITGEVLPPAVVEPPEEPDLPSMTLRETLTKMSDYPRETPEFIIQFAAQVEQHIIGKATKMPDEIPKVKSVVAAHLLTMAQKRNLDAMYEVFDQIDGKLAETIQLIGDDIYITQYITTAPPGAYLNDDGVLQLEASAAQDVWAQKLGTHK